MLPDTQWPLELAMLHDAAGLLDASGRILALNPGCARLLHLDPAAPTSLLGRPFRDLFEELSAALASQILKVVADEGHWHGEVFFRDGAGELAPVYLIASAIQDAAPAGPAYVFLALNYTEQHYAIGDQLKKQAILNRLLRSAPMAILVVDGAGLLVETNAQAQALWGLVGAPLEIGSAVTQAVVPLAPALRQGVARGLAGEAVRLPREPLTPTGDRLVSLECVPSRVRQGGVDTLLIFIEDRTLELRLEDKLRETERFASLGFMAANVGHEINNPLQSLRGALERMTRMRIELLSLRDEDEAAPRRMADLVAEWERTERRSLEVIERIAGIVRPVLDLARPHQVQVVEVSAEGLLQRTLDGLALHKALTGIVTGITLTDPIPLLRTDPGMVQQIITNLVINAAYVLGGRGAINLHAEGSPEGAVIITVQDSGPGITAAALPYLFTPFFTTKPVGEGTGLGLYASRAMAQKLGGWLEYVPERTPGACFRLTLPVDFTPGAEVGVELPTWRGLK